MMYCDDCGHKFEKGDKADEGIEKWCESCELKRAEA